MKGFIDHHAPFSLRIPKKRGLDFELKSLGCLTPRSLTLPPKKSGKWWDLLCTVVPAIRNSCTIFFRRGRQPKMKKQPMVYGKNEPLLQRQYTYTCTHTYKHKYMYDWFPWESTYHFFFWFRFVDEISSGKKSTESPKKNVRNSFQMVWP